MNCSLVLIELVVTLDDKKYFNVKYFNVKINNVTNLLIGVIN
jgi:hypothetical protein